MTINTGNSYLDGLGAKPAPIGNSKATIDQSGFLKLLTTQLTTQDPTAPVDNSQMAAQMAQFSSVAGISEMNASLKAMASDLAASRFGDASGWIGRSALVASDTAGALSNGGYAGQIALPADAKGLTLTLVDSSGQTVFGKDLGTKSAGTVDWGWDGKDAQGKAVAGPLRIIVSALATDGTKLQTSNAAWTEVQSVQSPTTGTTKLTTAIGSYAPADVIELG
jgi:flagellar basal-body rod modification protein FlgD